MKQHVKVYFEESSIHGFPYTVNRDLHVGEKILWIIALVISFVCCGFLIFKIGMKVQEDALVIYTSDTAIPIVEVSTKF
jgi:nitric oxide reductase large subunit